MHLVVKSSFKRRTEVFSFYIIGEMFRTNELLWIRLAFAYLFFVRDTTGIPSSKYEHRRASALLRNIQNIRICMGKRPIVSLTYENERISIKKLLTLLKICVTSLLCGPRVDLWPFYGFLCKRFSLYIKVYPGVPNLGKLLYKEKTVYIKTHETAINRSVDHTGET